MAGTAWRAASATRIWRELKKKGSEPTCSAAAWLWTRISKATSKSGSLLAFRMCICRPSACRILDVFKLPFGIWISRVHEKRDLARGGHQLMQQPKPLSLQIGGEEAHARNVAARSIETGDQAELDRITAIRKNDRNSMRCSFGCERGLNSAGCHEHGHPPPDQFCGQCRQTVIVTVCKPSFEQYILTVNVARFVQTLQEGDPRRRKLCSAAEQSDYRHRVLAARR